MYNEEFDKEFEELSQYNIGPMVEDYIKMVEENNLLNAIFDKWNRWFDENHYIDGFHEQMIQISKDNFMCIVSDICNDIMNGINSQKQFDNEH